VLLGKTVRVAIEESEAMIAVIGYGLAGGMVRANLLGERGFALLDVAGRP
jgi:hypothetical protein